MMMRFDKVVSLPSGNTARNFCIRDRGHGRVQIIYSYTDRRRAHQVSRHYTVEFLNGKIDSIQARSANGGRVEYFTTSTIRAELLEMLAEFNEVVNGVAARNEPAKVEAPVVEPEQDSYLLNTLKTVGGMVMVNILITLATLGIVSY